MSAQSIMLTSDLCTQELRTRVYNALVDYISSHRWRMLGLGELSFKYFITVIVIIAILSLAILAISDHLYLNFDNEIVILTTILLPALTILIIGMCDLKVFPIRYKIVESELKSMASEASVYVYNGKTKIPKLSESYLKDEPWEKLPTSYIYRDTPAKAFTLTPAEIEHPFVEYQVIRLETSYTTTNTKYYDSHYLTPVLDSIKSEVISDYMNELSQYQHVEIQYVDDSQANPEHMEKIYIPKVSINPSTQSPTEYFDFLLKDDTLLTLPSKLINYIQSDEDKVVVKYSLFSREMFEESDFCSDDFDDWPPSSLPIIGGEDNYRYLPTAIKVYYTSSPSQISPDDLKVDVNVDVNVSAN